MRLLLPSILPAVIALLCPAAHATPDPPELLSPEDGATVGPAVVFEALVTDSDGAALDANVFVRAKLEDLVPFRLAVIPDTQFYTEEQVIETHGDITDMQVDWILDNAEDSNTVFATHLGDLVQDWDAHDQWMVADAAMSQLDGVLPYGITWGNHEVPTDFSDPGWDALLLDEYFPLSRYEDEPWWGGSWMDDNTWNTWQTITVGGLDLLFVHLMFEPQEDELAWAAEVIASLPDHFVIISTHSFLDSDGSLLNHATFDAQNLWDAIVAPFDNVRLVLNGHSSGEANRSDLVAGQAVHQMLTCYHGDGDHGSGWLRVLDFDPENGTLEASTYSPYLDSWQDDEDSQFSLNLPLAPLEWWVTYHQVVSGSTLTSEWPSGTAGTWEWWVKVEDGAGNSVRSEIRSFTVDAQAPTIAELLVTVLGSDSVQLDWTSDEPADSRVELGPDSSYGLSVQDEALTTEHSVVVDGLEAGASYLFGVSSHDAVGNASATETGSFTTDGGVDTNNPDDTGDPQDPGPCGCGAAPATGQLAGVGLVLCLGLAVRRRNSVRR